MFTKEFLIELLIVFVLGGVVFGLMPPIATHYVLLILSGYSIGLLARWLRENYLS